MFNPLNPVNRTKLATFSKIALAAFWLALIRDYAHAAGCRLSAAEGKRQAGSLWGVRGTGLSDSHDLATYTPACSRVAICFWSGSRQRFYGVLDEVTQLAVGRDCTSGDWTADALGAAAGSIDLRLAAPNDGTTNEFQGVEERREH